MPPSEQSVPPGGGGADRGGALSESARAYALRHAFDVLGVRPSAGTVGRDLERLIFRELSREPELETAARDAWGNWEYPYGEAHLRGDLYEPWLDHRILETRGTPAGPPGLSEPRWPDGKRFALCLTHDVDLLAPDLSQAHSARIAWRNARLLLRSQRDRATLAVALRSMAVAVFQLATLRGLRARETRSFDEWTALEESYGFRSTFLFFAESLREPHVFDSLYSYDDFLHLRGRRVRLREWMRELRRDGWEVGLHGSYHSATRPGLLQAEKAQVESAAGAPVVSTRQHWLHYDARLTPRLQAEAGLLADSTQGFNRNVGFRAGTAFPYACWDFDRGRPLDVLEIPQIVMDGALFTPNALEYDEDLAVRHALHLLEAVEAVGGCLTLNWHPNTLAEPRYWEVYRRILEEAAGRGAWGCTMGDLRTWWRTRQERIHQGVSSSA